MPIETDLLRLQKEYTDREHRLASSDLYSPLNLANLFTIQQRQRMVVSLLKSQGFASLVNRSILEVGCGNGGVLLEFLNYGASPRCLHGIDLLSNRVNEAHRCRLPSSPLACADGQNLPFLDREFDIVLQFTAFSSILDNDIKAKIALEMLRVVKTTGIILWYDFWINPTNKQTRGILPEEIVSLFPNCKHYIRKITLAPPIARKVAPLYWGFAALLESVGIFNSHYLAAIRPIS